MIGNLIQDLKDAPARLAGRTEALGRRARTVRSEGETRLWQAQTGTLERVGAWLHEGRALGPLTGAAEKLVGRRLTKLTTVPVPGYEALNARDASRAVRVLESKVALLVVRRHEEATKSRKTVLRAIEEQLERLERPSAGSEAPSTAEPAAS